ncbi:fimbria/pilus periplasmic chaperone [Nostoc sp. CHAB 5784]|uniref:fimbrial biogenesis chaperone n=1 Tax=Nostoc mirabile TaxID=2907820 RepID=UPI001E40C31E|nr:fimbria/pilus periplasmic chaperone [Nostoc mirabile]MCC5662995.1 fimbria/pilus periplasmic chaperone [Nostoc mirabile CHAB5784]
MKKQKVVFGRVQKICGSVLAAVSALTLGCNFASAISIGVSPPRFEVKLDQAKASTQVFRVSNMGSKPATFKLYVQGWKLDEKNEIQPTQPTEQSLDQWIVVNPLQFTIPPGRSQTVRFSIRPRVKPQTGEHRALIFLEEVRSQDNTEQKNGSVALKVMGRFGVAVYGYVGDVKRVGVLNSVAVDTKPGQVKATFDVSSKGSAYVRMSGQYTIWPAAKYPGANATKQIPEIEKPRAKLPDGLLAGGTLPSTPVLPDTRRQILLNIANKLPPGKYVLDLNGELNGIPVDQGIPFTVPAVANVSVQPQTKPANSSPIIRRLRRN